MYTWIWRHLPGGLPGKAMGSLVLFLGVVALLFFVLFPRLQSWLPFNDVTIDRGSNSSSSPSPSPNP